MSGAVPMSHNLRLLASIIFCSISVSPVGYSLKAHLQEVAPMKRAMLFLSIDGGLYTVVCALEKR